jgi:hypothetical protein
VCVCLSLSLSLSPQREHDRSVQGSNQEPARAQGRADEQRASRRARHR